MIELMTYAEAKKLLGWRDNKTIRTYCAAGKLVRVQIGSSKQDWRITAESVRKLLAERAEYKATRELFGKTEGQMKAMRQAKAQRAAHRVPEVMIDEAEVREQAVNLRTAPEPVVDAHDDLQVPERAPARPDWRERNRWLENGMIGPDPWAPQRR